MAPTLHRPVLLIAAVFSRYDDAIAWARRELVTRWGPIELEAGPFAFEQTRFYEPSMGSDLKKLLVAHRQLIDPSQLPTIKHAAIQIEARCRAENSGERWPETRPLNVDPGYVTEAKLILASTKDRDHRIYLGNGIYAEGTLYYQGGAWQTRSWTYPDYRSPEYHQFFDACRAYLRQAA